MYILMYVDEPLKASTDYTKLREYKEKYYPYDPDYYIIRIEVI